MTIQKSDPDVIVGHEFLGVSLDVLLGRMKDLRADHWSRIGRFRRTKMNLGRPGTNLRLLYGRLVCDLASDGAKVRDSPSFFGCRYARVLLVGGLAGLDRLIVSVVGVFEKLLDHCTSNALYHCDHHWHLYHAPTLADAPSKSERINRIKLCSLYFDLTSSFH